MHVGKIQEWGKMTGIWRRILYLTYLGNATKIYYTTFKANGSTTSSG